MNKKYVLTNETIKINDKTLYRIKAIKDFDNVKAGDLGGFIEKEENLSGYGNAWVYDNAKVFGNAWVCGNAEVYDNAEVFGNAEVCGVAEVKKTRNTILFTKVGSRNDTLTAFKTKTGFSIKVGCFLGSLELFLEKVQETHGDNQFAKEYRLIAEVIKARFSEGDKDE